ncbi:Cache domain-containing protein, partial [Acidithiobacillus caldus]|nr:Cache domain-containing protein [Acidithiobacillus caldus]MBU2730136.1 Cache domain-containing protein [Acidithiobacillus caldus]
MNRFEHFRELRSDILRLIAGPLESIAQPTLFSCDAETQRSILRPLLDRHPFIELVYLLDPEGRQIGDNLASYRRRGTQGGAGADRSHRPYYRL